MAILDLVIAPNPIFRKAAQPVAAFDDELRATTNDMLETLYAERGIGIAANMVGLLKQIIVVDLQEEGIRSPLVCINPIITHSSDEKSTHEEASLCFPGIRVEVERAETIELQYQNIEGELETLEASGWLATVIQHEMDYLQGRTFLDSLSKLKRDRLIKKMIKDLKHAQSCGDPHCGHDHA